jgi:hypothetical protein
MEDGVIGAEERLSNPVFTEFTAATVNVYVVSFTRFGTV